MARQYWERKGLGYWVERFFLKLIAKDSIIEGLRKELTQARIETYRADERLEYLRAQRFGMEEEIDALREILGKERIHVCQTKYLR